MNRKMKIAKATIVAGLIGVGATPSFAQDVKNKDTAANNDASRTLPIRVGTNVLDQVEDVRETVGDLINSLQNAGEAYGYSSWNTVNKNLKSWETQVEDLKSVLERKEELVDDDAWVTYLGSTTYGTTIHGAVRDLGNVLTSIGEGMSGGKKTTNKLSLAVADDVVDQVDDVRETVGDLVSSIRNAEGVFTFYDWTNDSKKLMDYEKKLETLEQNLDKKESLADEEWTAWFGADVYKVTVHDSINELGSIMNGLAQSLSGKAENVAE